MPLRIAAGLLATVILVIACRAGWAAPPTLTRMFPPGAQRGSTVMVKCTGEFQWPVMVWAPGVDVVPQAESGRLLLIIPANLPSDRVWLRLYNSEGTSALMPFLVGSLREIVEQEPNNTLQHAQAIGDHSVTVNGVLQESGDVDGFSVSLVAGQTLVAAVEANSRLGSPMDAILQVVSADGVVLAENHDNIGLDPRLAFTAPSDGKYVVRLFAFPSAPDTNISFRGGADYVYRVTLTTGPFVSHTVPSAVPLNDPGTVELFGWNIPLGTCVPVTRLGGARLADDAEIEMPGDLRNSPDARLGFAFSPDFAATARVRIIPQAAIREMARGETSAPMTLIPPTAVTGWLQAPQPTDVFRVPLLKDQQVVISVESRSLDLPLHPVLKLTDPGGATVVTAEPAEPQDAVITHTAAHDGTYQLSIGDRYRHGGERCFYRLTVRLEEPDFEISAAADAIVVTPEKPTELVVTVQRRAVPNHTIGPVSINVTGLPAGVTAPAVISEPSGPTADKVTLVFSTDGSAFSGPIQIAGNASVPRTIQRFARTPPRFGVSHEKFWLTAIAAPAASSGK